MADLGLDKASQSLGFVERSDIQAIPQELCLIEGRLTTILRRTKTSGPNDKLKIHVA